MEKIAKFLFEGPPSHLISTFTKQLETILFNKKKKKQTEFILFSEQLVRMTKIPWHKRYLPRIATLLSFSPFQLRFDIRKKISRNT